ncbi:glycosyltransferase family 39 protein [bacterium]|nr:glycosyltransferase family 39 protein [bacterium]
MRLPDWKSPVYPITAGLILRITHLTLIFDSPILRILILDSEFYHNSALKIISGDIIGNFPFFMSPLYSYLTASIYSIIGAQSFAVVIFQTALSCLTLWMIWRLASLILNDEAAVIAAWLGAVFPVWIYFDGVLLTASIILFLNTAALLLLALWFKDHRIWRLFTAGIMLGLSASARPNILLFAAVLLFYLFNERLHKPAFYVFMGLILLIIPVSVRNYAVTGEFSLTTVSGGMNFYVGNNPDATGLYVEPPFIESSDPESEYQTYLEEARRLSWKDLSPAQASGYWYKTGMLYLLQNPLRWIQLWWCKFFYFWNNLEAPNNISIYAAQSYSPLLRVFFLKFGLLISLGIPGLFILPKSRIKTIFLLYLITILISNIIFFTSSEFRFPVIPLILIGASWAIIKIIDAVKNKKLRWHYVVLPLILLIFTFYRTPLAEKLANPRMDYLNIGSVLLRDGQPEAAVGFFEQAVSLDPSAEDAHLKMAYALFDLQRYDRAAAEFFMAGYPVTPENLRKIALQSDSLSIKLP